MISLMSGILKKKREREEEKKPNSQTDLLPKVGVLGERGIG